MNSTILIYIKIKGGRITADLKSELILLRAFFWIKHFSLKNHGRAIFTANIFVVIRRSIKVRKNLAVQVCHINEELSFVEDRFNHSLIIIHD